MATPKLTTTVDERAMGIAKRNFRIHVGGESARVKGSKKDSDGKPIYYFVTLTTCTCPDFGTRIFKGKGENYICKHIARLREEFGQAFGGSDSDV